MNTIIDKLKPYIGNFSLYFFASLISAAVAIAINPFLALNLSPNDYAIIGYFLSFKTLFLPLISFSLVSYYSRQYYIVTEQEIITIRNTIISFQLLIGFAIVLVIILLFKFYAESVDLSFHIFPYLHFFLLSIYFMNVFTVLLIEKRLSRSSKSFFKFSMIKVLIASSLALFLVVFLKLGAFGRLLGLCLTSAVIGLISIFHLRFKFTLDTAIIKNALNFSWPLIFSAILYYFFEGFDRILLERQENSETLGIYNVAFQITAYLGIFCQALIQTLEPDIYEVTSKTKIKRAIVYLGIIVTIVIVFSLLFVLLATPLIDVLTFGRYLNSVPFAKILVFRNVFMTFAFVSSIIVIGLGFPKVEFYNRLIGSAAACLIYWYLVEAYGFMGAAWGQSITLFVMGLVSIIFIIRKLMSITKEKES